MVEAIAAHPSLTDNAAWDAAFVDNVAGVAVAFDWLHPTLLPSDRDALTEVMLAAAAALNDPRRGTDRAYILSENGEFYRFAAYDHWGPRVLWAVAATGLALLGADPAAAELVDYARDLLRGWMLPALDDLSGGAWPAGPEPSIRATWALLQTVTAFWTARGEDYFADVAWWYDRLAYTPFGYAPAIHEGARGPYWAWPGLFGPGALSGEAGVLARAHDSLLATIYNGTEHAAWMGWFLNTASPDRSPPHLEGAYAADALLWEIEDTAAEPPPWLVWYTRGTGHAFMRSAWAGDDVTYVAFSAGDRYAADQFLAQGHLTLWRGDDPLLVRAGSAQGGAAHTANFYGRSAAANVPLICDLAEDFTNARPAPPQTVWLNDCGQRGMAPFSASAINSYYRAENPQAYETGTILRFAEEGGLVYFRADLTAAYNSPRYSTAGNAPKVQEVLREIVFIRPATILLHDRITPTAPDAALINPFHTPTAPSLAGDWVRVANGDSLLFWRDLVPENRVALAEGYEVAGQDVSPSGASAPAFQITSQPTINRAHHPFLTLMRLGAQTGQAPDARYVSGEGVYGAVFDTWQILFDDDPQDIDRLTAEIMPGVTDVLIVGLAPLGDYRVTLPDGMRESLLADDAGTLYIFTSQPGTLSLARR
ncbi:MAG: hypothetical protein ACLFTK_04135 [Anaerolineales bacterium]